MRKGIIQQMHKQSEQRLLPKMNLAPNIAVAKHV
jgi:hypothetical protein